MPKSSVAVIVLNWNDAKLLPKSVGSLLNQTYACDIIVVDNASEDNSREVITSFGNKINKALYNTTNKGFAGGVNTGITYALEKGYEFIALLNNDAVADIDWVKHLVAGFSYPKVGGVTCSLLREDGKTYDSTGELMTIWGLPYPRGRDEEVGGQYDKSTEISAVSGGASMYRASFFKDVGLFDEDFFAYYEDVDLSFRGQLAGWRFRFAPKAKVYHATGTTSGRVKNFSTLQTLKNLPWLLWKNVPLALFLPIMLRFTLVYLFIVLRTLSRGHLLTAAKGFGLSLIYLPKKLVERRRIQNKKVVSNKYIKDVLAHNLPPNAAALRRVQSMARRMGGKK